MSNFQIILIAAFLVFLVVGVLVFAGILPGFRPSPADNAGELVVWGVFPEAVMEETILDINDAYQDSFSLKYVAKNSARLGSELVNELASGRGPDIVIFPQEFLWSQRERFSSIPYDLLPQRDFLDEFADISQIYLNDKGITALPLVIDPLVFYYNKDLLRSQGISLPPDSWTKVLSQAPSFLQIDSRRNITQSPIALGEFGNINFAKDIFSLILLQAGNGIVALGEDGPQVLLAEARTNGLESASLTLNFFSQFADPAKAAYSWNSALPTSRDFFSAGSLAFYLGYASDYPLIKAKNPHLNFDVTLPPQKNELKRLTFGRLYGGAITIAARRPVAAVTALRALVSADFAGPLAEKIGLPSARRDLLAAPNDNPFTVVFGRAAVFSSAWLDPEPEATTRIFRSMVEAVKIGELNTNQAVMRADQELKKLITSAP